VVIQFHIKKFVHMGWADQEAQTKTKKQILHISKILTFPTYLSYPTRLTYVPIYLSTYLYE